MAWTLKAGECTLGLVKIFTVAFLFLFGAVLSAAPDSYSVPGGTAFLSDQGQIAVAPTGSSLQTWQYPAMGMWNNQWIPLSVDAQGNLNVNGGGGGSTSNVNIHDANGLNLLSTSNALNTFLTNSSIPVTQSTSPWLISGTVSTTPLTASSATITNVSTVSGDSVTLLNSNSSRKGLILYNQSAGFTCYVAFASTASSTAFTFQLGQGSSYHMDSTIYQGPISAYCSTGTILVTEM